MSPICYFCGKDYYEDHLNLNEKQNIYGVDYVCSSCKIPVCLTCGSYKLVSYGRNINHKYLMRFCPSCESQPRISKFYCSACKDFVLPDEHDTVFYHECYDCHLYFCKSHLNERGRCPNCAEKLKQDEERQEKLRSLYINHPFKCKSCNRKVKIPKGGFNSLGIRRVFCYKCKKEGCNACLSLVKDNIGFVKDENGSILRVCSDCAST